jgi:parallel beta-helix repeat protein
MQLRRFAVVSTLFVSFTTSGFAATLVVDNDFADCPQADFNSIQAAVTAAQPGDKILVCPGTYQESVLVNKSDLRIEAQAAPGEVVLQGEFFSPRPGFALRGVSGVRLEGFTVEGFRTNISIFAGSGNTIRKNILRSAVLGINLGATSGNIVEHNRAHDNRVSGIEVGSSATGNTVRNNETFGNGFEGIVVISGGSGNAIFENEVYNNTAEPDGAGIAIVNTPAVTVENNRVFNNHRSGITIRASTAVTVRHNKVQRNGRNGIRLFDNANNNVVEKNELEENVGNGVSLEDSDTNTIQLNRSRQNEQDGIHADSNSMGNRIERNVLFHNVEHDAHDDSVGPGTGGTANFWINNKCETDNRGGFLCEAPAH